MASPLEGWFRNSWGIPEKERLTLQETVCLLFLIVKSVWPRYHAMGLPDWKETV
jgi:hypothetical protein